MVQIITDSSCLFTVEEGKEMGIEVLPLCVSIGELEGRDTQISMDAFYAEIEKGNNPTSSQPPIGEVMEAFERYPDACRDYQYFYGRWTFRNISGSLWCKSICG